ncbi:DUF2206 domain-containing protein [Halorarum halophilum]|uniref:DUF2206 domain-containing protein n=1 Tax=Halorarum halophilum TaxID=2743090 RepID=A0A7D5H2K6_9EURY|nr:DUF2206 domain-containing protein [Halobaculum halophilum]QLG29213.1 DUF2206 domain-containing protein [Halobaculum halophilum]
MGGSLETLNTVEVDERIAIVLALALAIGLVAFEGTTIGDEYTVVQGVTGTLASLFVPGFLLLLVARINRPAPQMLAYAVGVSCAFLLLIGVVTNFLLPGLGVERPLRRTPLVLALSLVALSVLAYARTNVTAVKRRTVTVSLQTLLAGTLLLLLPLLSFAATRSMNVGGHDAPMLVLIVLLASVPPLLITGVIPRRLRPVAVWSVSLSVLLQMTLVSSHLWGWDIHFEYATARTIYQTGVWELADSSLLTVTFLAAVFATVTGIDLVSVYKLIYPVIASLLPVAIYYFGTLEFDGEWVATLAPFGLVFYYGYFKIMPDKQIVAQLFLVLVLITLFSESANDVRSRTLAVAFGTMLIVSHYIVSLFFIAFLATTVVTVAVARRVDVLDMAGSGSIRPSFVTLLGVEWAGWYLFSASGGTFERVVLRGYEAVIGIGGPTSGRSGAGYATKAFGSPLWSVYRLLYIALIGLFTLGLVWTLYSAVVGETDETDPEYAVFSAFVLALLVSSVVTTFGIGFDRILLFSLVALAPFAPVGAAVGFSLLSRVSRGVIDLSPSGSANVFAAFLAVLFLFSSGGAFAVTGHQVPTYSINLDQDAGWPVYTQSEVDATRWLADEMAPGSNVAVYNEWSTIKSRDAILLREVIPPDRMVLVSPAMTELEGATYIYVSDRPMASVGNREAYIDPERTRFYARNVVPANLVYAGDGVRIYRVRPSDEGGDQAPNSRSNSPDERQYQDAVQCGAPADC